MSLSLKNMVLSIALVFTLILLSGCSAMHTVVKKRDLDVQTKMSETIFLEPTMQANKIIFVDVRNTSDKDINVKNAILAKLQSNGYTITDNPNEARFMLQGNILRVAKTDLREAGSALQAGFGGAVIGVAAASASNSAARGYAVAGLAGAAAGLIGDALVDDVLYMMVTDLQIRERPLTGEQIVQTQSAKLAQGSATNVSQNISGAQVQWKTYRTRIVSTANKVNLDYEEAQPKLEAGLIRSIGGLF